MSGVKKIVAKIDRGHGGGYEMNTGKVIKKVMIVLIAAIFAIGPLVGNADTALASSRVSGLKAEAKSYSAVRLTWHKAKGAKYYTVYRSKTYIKKGRKKVAYKRVRKVKRNSTVIGGLAPGKTYSFKVCANGGRKSAPVRTDTMFKVTFRYVEGSMSSHYIQSVSTSVKKGGSVRPPKYDSIDRPIEGYYDSKTDTEYVFTGWDASCKNIRKNTVINAKYDKYKKKMHIYKVPYNEQRFLDAVNSIRRERGTGQLVIDRNLAQRAAAKAKQIYDSDLTSYKNTAQSAAWVNEYTLRYATFKNDAFYKWENEVEDYEKSKGEQAVEIWNRHYDERTMMLDNQYKKVGFGCYKCIVVAFYGK